MVHVLIGTFPRNGNLHLPEAIRLCYDYIINIFMLRYVFVLFVVT